MWETILTTIVTALGTAFVTGVKQWMEDRQTANMQQQLGALSYENVAQQSALAQAKEAQLVTQVIRSLSDADLAARMQSTNAAIGHNATNGGSAS